MRSFISVVERDAPTLVDVAEPMRVGHAHVGEEHLVERRAAGHLTQRPDLDAGSCMSMRNIVMPLCLGLSGEVRVMISPMSENCAPDVHTFWPVSTHSSPSRIARGLDAGEVGARDRLGEQLAADDVAAPQRAEVALADFGDAVGEDRGRDHAEADDERRLVGRAVARR